MIRRRQNVLAWVAVAVLVGLGIGAAARVLAVHPVRVSSGSTTPTPEMRDVGGGTEIGFGAPTDGAFGGCVDVAGAGSA